MIQIEKFCGGVFQTNGYLVTVNDGEHRFLFDAPEHVVDWLEQKKIPRLDGLILTHQHHDHVIGAGALLKKFQCPVRAHSQPSDDLTLASRLREITGMPCELDPYQVDHLFEGETGLELGGIEFQLLHIPGHSPDSVCFRFPDDPVVIAGDVLFNGSIGRTDFPHGNHQQLIDGIREKLWPLSDETQILPGHGPATTIGNEKADNPYIPHI